MRNTNSRFAVNPQVHISRSSFPRKSTHKTTFNAGKLVPIFVDEVLPGDTFKMRTDALIRMSTPIHPVMDNCFLDLYYFFVPCRLVWDKWQEFMGENPYGPWQTSQSTNLRVPEIAVVENGDEYFVKPGSIIDHMGIPTNVRGFKFNALPVRSFCKIWNDWFFDQRAFYPIEIPTGDYEVNYWHPASSDSYFEASSTGSILPPVAKFHDYFTSALPEPQRGPDVFLPFSGEPIVRTSSSPFYSAFNTSTPPMTFGVTGMSDNWLTGSVLDIKGSALAGRNGTLMAEPDSSSNGQSMVPIYPNNMYVDMDEALGTSINELRFALALQRFYETDARGGTRYTEIIRSHFGVLSPDARLQRSEYLGGKRIDINIQQVLQTSSTDSTSPQGNTAAFSLTAAHDDSFIYSATEHGYIIGVCCVRTSQTYQYGLERMWNRRDREDFYWPTFAHIGEQPILNKELYLQGNHSSEDDEAFGYQEAFAEYRYKNSYISGMFRSNHPQSLDSWHYAEELTSMPTLSPEFLSQSSKVVDRTLAVSSDLADQFLADFYFDLECVRPMPTYSIPGLSSHF